MEFVSYLFVICLLFVIVLAIVGAISKVTKNPSIKDDLVNFIFEEAEDLFNLLTEDFRDDNYEVLAEMFNGWMVNIIKASSLPDELKSLASLDNVSLLSKPMLEFLYNKKFGKTRLIELRRNSYSEEEELLLIQEEMRFLYERIVTKKQK